MSWRPRDPLAIDLDADGIETVGIGANPILFDHNADGIRTGTGWVRSDDAWLVLDRDSNGAIDSGRELFGVDTQITVGGVTRNATSGFEALASLDANADGTFNASDAEFANVRLWQDSNQDGISQSNELVSLAQAGITAIGLTPSGGTVNLGNGNSITGQATVTRSSGASTTVGSVSIGGDTNAGNLNLADNPFYREFTTPVPLTATAQALPEMGGSGWVRDLREAMSLPTPEAQALAATVAAFAAATTRDAQMALLDQLLRDWAKTNQTRPMTTAWFSNAAPAGGMIDPGSGVAGQLTWAVPILEVFNGQAVQGSGALFTTTTATSTANGQVNQTLVLNSTQSQLLLNSYAALRDSVYSALVVQTRLQPYLDSIELVIDETGIRFDTAALSAMLGAAQAADATNAMVDLVELNRYAFETLQAVGFDGLGTLSGWVASLPAGSPTWAVLVGLGVFTGTTASGTAGRDIYLGDVNNGSFSGGEGADLAHGGDGADALAGGSGNDSLNGGDGADSLNGQAGNDTLDGGAGNDWLSGETGNNTYLFGRGDGQDTLAYYYDTAAGKLNTVQFKSGVAPSDIVLKQVSDYNWGTAAALEVSIAGTTDKLTINGFAVSANPGSGYNPVQQFVFADGTVWSLAQIQAQLYAGSAAADNLTGTVNGESISGQAGNDAINAGGGSDTLSGGEGSDILAGGTGNDTYLMSRGFGAEIIQESDPAAGNIDVIQFLAGVTSDQIWLRQVGSDLEVSIIGTADKMTVQNWYSGSQYRIERFATTDGKVLLDSKVQELVSAMAAFAPPAIGQTTLPANYQSTLLPLIAADWGP